EIEIGNCLEVDLMPSSKPIGAFYHIGVHCDDQAGGWLVSEMIENIKLCIFEKNQKINKRYNEWWLVLVDYISHGMLDKDDYDSIRSSIDNKYGWSKIIILSRDDVCFKFEI